MARSWATGRLPLLVLVVSYLTCSENLVVAKSSSEQVSLLENVNYACSQVDWQIIKDGSPFVSPDNLINHASVVMNLYYQSRGRNPWNCDFSNSGLIAITHPSYNNCIYP